jgi:hypothetical protein
MDGCPCLGGSAAFTHSRRLNKLAVGVSAALRAGRLTAAAQTNGRSRAGVESLNHGMEESEMVNDSVREGSLDTCSG